MMTIVDMYRKTKQPVYFQAILNYIENESKLQNLETISGLGEPKYNINCTAFNGSWGRPQNDGPALRGIILFQVIELFSYKYETMIRQLILPIILLDLEYILQNYRKVSYDIWEEKLGWHFYTRMVQAKFLKETLRYKKMFQGRFDIASIEETYQRLLNDLKDHINGDTIISSFDENGDIIKYEDSANLLAFCHINYDEDILKIIPLEYINHTCDNLIDSFP